MILPAIVLGSLLYAVIDDYNNPPKSAKSEEEKFADACRAYQNHLNEKGKADKK